MILQGYYLGAPAVRQGTGAGGVGGGGAWKGQCKDENCTPNKQEKIITVTLKPQNKATPVLARVFKSAYLTHCAIQLK